MRASKDKIQKALDVVNPIVLNISDFRIYDSLQNYSWLARKYFNNHGPENPSFNQVLDGIVRDIIQKNSE